MGARRGKEPGSQVADFALARLRQMASRGLLRSEPVEVDDPEPDDWPQPPSIPPLDLERCREVLMVELDLSHLDTPDRDRILATLTTLSPDELDLEVPAPWYGWRLKSPVAAAQRDGTGLVEVVLNTLTQLHVRQPEMGAVVVLATGLLRRSGPMGEVALCLDSAEDRLVPGKILFVGSFGAVKMARGVSWHVSDPQTILDREIPVWTHFPPPFVLPDVASSDLDRTFTLMSRQLNTRQEVVRYHRDLGVSRRPNAGDSLRLYVKAPPWATIYLLRERQGRVDLPVGPNPVVEQGDPSEPNILYPLEVGAHPERPVLLVANQPIPELGAMLAQPGGAESLVELVGRLHSFPDLRFGLAPYESVDYTPPQVVWHSDWKRILEAREQNQLQHAADLCQDLLSSGDELGEDERVEAYLLLGEVYLKQDQDLAASYLKQAQDLATSFGDMERQAKALRLMSRLYLHWGQRQLAESHLLDAQKIHPGNQVDRLRDDLSLAGIRLRGGEWDAALTLYQGVVSSLGEGEYVKLKAAALQGVGVVALELGRLAEANQSLLRALELCEVSGNTPGIFRVLGDLGNLSQAQGRLSAAVAYFRRQVELRAHGSPQEQHIAQLGLIQALMEKGDFSGAEAILQQISPELPSGDLRNQVARLWLEGELRLHQQDTGALDALLPLLHAHHDVPQDLTWRLLRLGAQIRAFLRQPDAAHHFEIAVRFLEDHRAKFPVELRHRYFDVRQSLFQRWLSCLVQEGASSEVLLGVVERIRARTLLEHLQKAGGGQAGSQNGIWPDFPSVLAQIAADAQLRDAAFLVWQVLDESILAFIVYQGVVQHVVLPWERTRRQVELPAIESWLLRPTPSPAAWSDLSTLLLGQFREQLAALPEDTLLGLAPNGPLMGLPLHALEDPARPGHPLLGRLVPFVVPSLATALHLIRSPLACTSGALVLADPPTAGLAYARQEGAHVLEHVPGEMFVGSEATLEVLRQKAPQARIIHLVTHARRMRRENPGAILLAQGGGEGGTVEVGTSELLSLKLSGQLVVLSACEAGGGQSTWFGEGPDLLSWALLEAGARCVISSLWRVSDKATPDLMAKFYQALAQGKPPARALVAAQRHRLGYHDENIAKQNCVSHSMAVPWSCISDWAAFVALGDGGSAAI